MLQSLHNCIKKTSFALLFNLSPRGIMVDIVMFLLSVFIDFARPIVPSAILSEVMASLDYSYKDAKLRVLGLVRVMWV